MQGRALGAGGRGFESRRPDGVNPRSQRRVRRVGPFGVDQMMLRRRWTWLLASLTAAMPVPALAQAPQSQPTSWRVEDFSTYTSDENYRANPHGWQIPSPRWFNHGKLHLDPTVTYEGHQTLRYDWSTPPTPTAWCMKDITRGAGYKAPDVPEMWIEIAHKFAPTFDTNKRGMGGACGVAEYKFLLFWLKTPQGGHRFDVTSGMNGNQWWSAHPGGANQTAYGTNCSGVGFKCGWATATGRSVSDRSCPRRRSTMGSGTSTGSTSSSLPSRATRPACSSSGWMACS